MFLQIKRSEQASYDYSAVVRDSVLKMVKTGKYFNPFKRGSSGCTTYQRLVLCFLDDFRHHISHSSEYERPFIPYDIHMLIGSVEITPDCLSYKLVEFLKKLKKTDQEVLNWYWEISKQVTLTPNPKLDEVNVKIAKDTGEAPVLLCYDNWNIDSG